MFVFVSWVSGQLLRRRTDESTWRPTKNKERFVHVNKSGEIPQILLEKTGACDRADQQNVYKCVKRRQLLQQAANKFDAVFGAAVVVIGGSRGSATYVCIWTTTTTTPAMGSSYDGNTDKKCTIDIGWVYLLYFTFCNINQLEILCINICL